MHLDRRRDTVLPAFFLVEGPIRVGVLGGGYVGLTTGACLAEAGHEVVIVDNDVARVDLLAAGGVPFYEPGLKALLDSARARDAVCFTADMTAVAACEVVVLALRTPSRPDGSCDTSVLLQVVREVAPLLGEGTTVVVKSTVTVGTTDQVQDLLDAGGARMCYAAMNPEFLREGCAIHDFRHPDRVVVGCRHARTREVLQQLLASFFDDARPLIFMDPRSAELCKYAANAYLAMRVAYLNEIAVLTERVGADVDAVRRAVGADPRIGSHYLEPGPGYAGACLPKDVRALVHMGRSAGHPLQLAEATHASNEAHRDGVVEQIARALGTPLAGRRLALWGLSFKAHSDDCREALSRTLIARLASEGVEVVAFDPQAGAGALGPVSDSLLRFATSPLDAAEGADVVAILTEWPVFAATSLDAVAAAMRGCAVVDARNVLHPARVREAGLDYFAIGRRL